MHNTIKFTHYYLYQKISEPDTHMYDFMMFRYEYNTRSNKELGVIGE